MDTATSTSPQINISSTMKQILSRRHSTRATVLSRLKKLLPISVLGVECVIKNQSNVPFIEERTTNTQKKELYRYKFKSLLKKAGPVFVRTQAKRPVIPAISVVRLVSEKGRIINKSSLRFLNNDNDYDYDISSANMNILPKIKYEAKSVVSSHKVNINATTTISKTEDRKFVIELPSATCRSHRKVLHSTKIIVNRKEKNEYEDD